MVRHLTKFKLFRKKTIMIPQYVYKKNKVILGQ